MRLALALGQRNLGRTWPNPSVGAVVVRSRRRADRRRRASRRRAAGRMPSRIALAMAGAAARGATLYVTPRALLPSRPHAALRRRDRRGRHRARRRRRCEDPDPRVAGRGHAPAARRPASRSTTGVLARRGRARPSRPHHPRDAGPAEPDLKLAQTPDGFAGAPGRAPADHRARSPTARCISCARRPTRSWSASARRAPTIPRSTCGCPASPTARRCGSCSTPRCGCRPRPPRAQRARHPDPRSSRRRRAPIHAKRMLASSASR